MIEARLRSSFLKRLNQTKKTYIVAAKRKYTKFGEVPTKYKCTVKKCGWEGTQEQKEPLKLEDGWTEDVCPKCKNNEFYGLI